MITNKKKKAERQKFYIINFDDFIQMKRYQMMDRLVILKSLNFVEEQRRNCTQH
jgi:hypothetical protein